MSLLSDAYAGQKTPVSGQRATYWAMKAAEAGDPQGWLVLGFEYNTGKLGGDPPYWHQKAMEAYRKAADGGNCLAMMAIGDLYAEGNGVRADQAQAQSWHAKAQSCQGGNLACLQQQVAQYQGQSCRRARSLLAALPAIPKSTAPVDRIRHGSRGSRQVLPCGRSMSAHRRAVMGRETTALVARLRTLGRPVSNDDVWQWRSGFHVLGWWGRFFATERLWIGTEVSLTVAATEQVPKGDISPSRSSAAAFTDGGTDRSAPNGMRGNGPLTFP